MTPRTRRGATAARLALAALAGVVLLIVVTQPLWLAPLLARQLTGPEQREVRIERATVGLTMALEPVLHLHGVHIANAPWADRSRPLLRAAEVVAVGSWRSFWAERRLVSLLVLRDAEIDLERQADGTRNWRLRDPDNRGPGRYRILRLRAERSSLRLVHDGVDLEFLATVAPTAGAERGVDPSALPMQYRFNGHWRGVPFTSLVAAEAELTLYETGHAFALNGRIDVGDARLDAEGRAGDLLRDQVADLRVQASGASLAALVPLIGTHGIDRRGFRIDGHLFVDDRRYRLDEAKARFGKTDLEGSVAMRRDDAGRRAFEADLRSASADTADFIWLLGRPGQVATASAAAKAGATADPSRGAAKAQRPEGPASAPAHFAGWRASDGHLRYRAQRLRAAEWPMLQSLAFDADLRQGTLKLAAVEVGVASGVVTGNATFDTAQAPAAATVELRWRELQLEQLLPAQKESNRLGGRLGGHSRLHAAGDSVAAMQASLAGDFEATLRNGTIASSLDAKMGLEGGNLMKSLFGGSKALALPCASLQARLGGGTATLSRFVIDSEQTRTFGSGRIDFAQRSLDVVLTPQAKQDSVLNLHRSIHLTGPLAKPQKALIASPPLPPGAACGASAPSR